tara:strand:+ start:1325 stop:2509 length:1185 start_codon:yes stop_codon:yes gene_type:complete
MLEETWRWFGNSDPITLDDIKMTGVKGIVSALHEIPIGEIWPLNEIVERKKIIEEKGMKWSVVESIPVHESIKYGGYERDSYIKNYIESIKNMSEAGINILCYNFMPVVDWTRTNLMYRCDDGSYALRFDIIDFIIFDLFILKRERNDCLNDYDYTQIIMAEDRHKTMIQKELDQLALTILRGLPGSMVDSYDLDGFKKKLEKYRDMSKEQMQNNLKYFLEKVIPYAEKYNVYMAIHPDDPPINLFGIPRIVSSIEDIEFICNTYNSEYNGITLCVGSYASSPFNDINEITTLFANKVNFIHLRNVKKDRRFSMKNSFVESDHLDGDVNMAFILNTMLRQKKIYNIPFRPDHGHLMLDDINKNDINPGYSMIGRLRGISELRGLILGLSYESNI